MGYPAYSKPNHSHWCQSHTTVQGAGYALQTDGEAQGQSQPILDFTVKLKRVFKLSSHPSDPSGLGLLFEAEAGLERIHGCHQLNSTVPPTYFLL